MSRLDRIKELVARFYSGIIRTESLYALTIRQYRESVFKREVAEDPKLLTPYGWSGFSQNDEDGIIQEIFRRIGIANHSFVEFGSGDCLLNAGTYLLLCGWKGLWIDSQADELAHIHNHFGAYEQSGDLVVKQAFITPENIDELLAANSEELDLLVIDIDGNDYYVWQAISRVRPRVVMIEYNATFRPPAALVQRYKKDFFWRGGNFYGASLKALEVLGRNKGYLLSGCNFVGTNAFFVREDVAGDCFSAPFTAEHHFREQWIDGSSWGYTRQHRVMSSQNRFEILDLPDDAISHRLHHPRIP
jgi:hypothetical protein